MIKPLAFSLIALFSTTSFAQSDVFKGVDSSGKVIYSNNPAFVKKPEKAKLPPPAIEGIEPYQVQDKNTQPGQNLKNPTNKTDNKNPAIEKSETELATDRLSSAKKAATDAETPLEGERTGTVKKGKTRLNDEYYSRQEQAKKELNDAQKNYDAQVNK